MNRIAHSQHRDFRAHRLGQDHAQRADPVLRRPHPSHPGGPRRRGHHGPHGAGEGTRDHDHQRGHDGRVGRRDDQPDRHARPRRFHRRSRAEPPRARRRRARALRRGRRPGPVADDRPPDAALRRAADRVYQQDGPHGRRSAARSSTQLREKLGCDAAVDAVAHRRRGRLPRRDRPGRPKGALLRRRQRRERPRGGDSRRTGRRGRPGPGAPARSVGDVQRRVDGVAAGRGGGAAGA